MRIVDNGGVYSGRIEKLLETTMAPDAVCKECTDERKDKPVVGLVIVRNMKQSADDRPKAIASDTGKLGLGQVLGDRSGQGPVLLDQDVRQPAGTPLLRPLLPRVELLAGLGSTAGHDHRSDVRRLEDPEGRN